MDKRVGDNMGITCYWVSSGYQRVELRFGKQLASMSAEEAVELANAIIAVVAETAQPREQDREGEGEKDGREE